MDVHAAIREDHDALVRIVAMLLALAALAERAGSLSHPVRCLVLWILRPAEAVARAFVTQATPTPLPAFFETPALGGNDHPGEAIRLAKRLRALAAALSGLLQRVTRLVRLTARIEDERIREVDTPLAEADCTALGARKPNDTS